jgi:hypothetical protein
MGFVIKNMETGKFVAKPGSEKSYTKDIMSAKVFETEFHATQYGVCGNEKIISLSSLFIRNSNER